MLAAEKLAQNRFDFKIIVPQRLTKRYDDFLLNRRRNLEIDKKAIEFAANVFRSCILPENHVQQIIEFVQARRSAASTKNNGILIRCRKLLGGCVVAV